MEFVEPVQARSMPGLRLALSVVGGPWGEAAKRVFQYKKVPFVPVAQYPGQENKALQDWTGRRNAPIAVYEDEPPCDGWLEILMLAERLVSSSPLLPENSADRALVVGIANELCGAWGMGWCRRLMLFDGPMQAAVDAVPPAMFARMRVAYGITTEATAAAPARVANVLRMLANRLKTQSRHGSAYFVGNELTAADLYWACFSAMVNPMANEVVAMDDWVRAAYSQIGPVVEVALAPSLIEHRDMVFSRHLTG